MHDCYQCLNEVIIIGLSVFLYNNRDAVRGIGSITDDLYWTFYTEEQRRTDRAIQYK